MIFLLAMILLCLGLFMLADMHWKKGQEKIQLARARWDESVTELVIQMDDRIKKLEKETHVQNHNPEESNHLEKEETHRT